MTRFEKLSGVEIGKLVNDKVVKPIEIVKYFEDRIEEHNHTVNAVVDKHYEEAEKAALDLEELIMSGRDGGPLAGVPVALKDFLPSKQDWKHTYGGVKSINWDDEYDSEFTKAAEGLGAIVIGKTNAPSFGFRGVTDNAMFGPTSTPFNTEYNSGGSSGGSAAAVSAGMIPIAEGGDAGGSIRIPAAWCGCFGFKPSAGLVPSVCRPDAWAATHPYCCGGPITRSVEDAALIISNMQHYDPRDPLSVPLPKSDYRAMNIDKERPLEGLKIAVTTNFNLFPEPEKDVTKAIEDAVMILSHLGAIVAPPTFRFKHSIEEMQDAWLQGICIDTAIDMELWKKNGYDLLGDHRDEVSDSFIYWNKRAADMNVWDYRKFHEVRTDILDAHCDVFDRFDLIVAPVTGCVSTPNSVHTDDGFVAGPSEINGVKVDPLIGFGYTYLENMIGTPAASIPFAIQKDTNLPIGLQVIAPRYKDHDIFKVAYALEHINPWRDKYPFDSKE